MIPFGVSANKDDGSLLFIFRGRMMNVGPRPGERRRIRGKAPGRLKAKWKSWPNQRKNEEKNQLDHFT